VKLVADQHGAKFKQTVGDALLKAGFPAIHAVGRAASRPPRLIELQWGNPKHPKLTLVGKGVCFDSGGLNIKPGESMQGAFGAPKGAATVKIVVKEVVYEEKIKEFSLNKIWRNPRHDGEVKQAGGGTGGSPKKKS